ncbi:DUF2927 domain-containing protein [Rhodobacteraceae bacterium RKSG542]|uniref:DUF2927 domain-containing protein n=1 Tax=Pseudovibrio flavus TaxID=2529854 RepID=UPI0012BBDB4F|nr:DUF2927 domain-containing protein [Pseudovibrio flavus]MTI17250.1 DUF2927 domain-containing protein [Pseudovibrio flavus]
MYTISKSGKILDGPRQGEKEPIDYSWLASNEHKQDLFLNSAFGAQKRLQSITPQRDRIKKRRPNGLIDVVVSVSSKMEDPEGAHDKLINALRRIGKTTNLRFRLTKKPSKDVIFVAIGSRDYIYRNYSGLYEKLNRKGFFDHFLKLIPPKHPMCFVVQHAHPEHPKHLGLSSISLEDRFFESCLYAQLFQALGFGNIYGRSVGSVLDGTGRYKQPTHLDWLALKALYSEDIKAGMSRDQVEAVLPSLM